MNDLYIREINIDWSFVNENSYLRKIPVLSSLNHLAFHRNITFFAGENGTGKSTLLEGIAVASGFNAEGGTRNYAFSTYDDVSELSEAIRIIRGARKLRFGYFLRAESFYNVASATMTLYNDDGTLPDYHSESHGESFLTFITRCDPNGLYLMDEPEAALSPQRQLTLLIHLMSMAEKGAQFIIATHSPILLGIPNAEILSFDGDTLHPLEYEETESYKITKLFVENRQRILKELMEED